MRGARWTFTINNYSDQEIELLTEFAAQDLCTYMVFGEEHIVGADGGTPHLQGYFETSRRILMTALKKRTPFLRAHLEKARNSASTNKAYCSKGDQSKEEWNELGVDGPNYGNFAEVREFGTPKKQGKRNDLIEIRNMIDNGASIHEVSQEHFGSYIRYHAGIDRYASLRAPIDEMRYEFDTFPQQWRAILASRNPDRSMILWGEPGIGKTQFAKAMIGSPFLMISHLDELIAFDPNFHKGIIFDDMDFTHLPRSSQIYLTDAEERRAIHIRYRVANIPRRTFKIFTTNIAGGRIFDLEDGAIKRRLEIHHLDPFIWRFNE